MKIQTTRFKEVSCDDSEIVTFPEGLLGFEDIRRYVILDVPLYEPLKWLQAVDVPALAFVMVDPALLFPDYRVKVARSDVETIGLADASMAFVYVTLVVGEDPARSTVNLKGPLVFNLERRLAKQLVLADPGVSARRSLRDLMEAAALAPA